MKMITVSIMASILNPRLLSHMKQFREHVRLDKHEYEVVYLT